MPHKVNFKVVHASGEEENHPSNELNSNKHGPLVQGWIAPKFCLYPVDIVIEFDKRTILNKVQILSHQFLIASKAEFFIGDCPDGNANIETARYTRLGYVELSSNERTDFKARELKSVHVDAEGLFLKLVLHKNHVNRLNLYNQVGVIAINVIGTDKDNPVPQEYLKDYDADPSVIAAISRPDYVSPLDDLAFAMYQDPEISQIIRSLDKKKTEYVIAEKYDEAKKLKQAVTELYRIGERLARYDIEKRQAIEDEDYEKAKAKKQQMQEYRAETYKQLQKHNLLDYIDMNSTKRGGDNTILRLEFKNFESSPRSLQSRRNDELPPIRNKSPPIAIANDILNNHTGATNSNTSFAKRNDTANSPPPTFLTQVNVDSDRPKTPYEDRLIPTLRNNRSRLERPDAGGGGGGGGRISVIAGTIDENAGDGVVNTINTSNGAIEEEIQDPYDPATDAPEEMTERDIREAAQMNDYLGKQIVTKLYSKNFQAREEAIQEVSLNLSNFKGDKEEAKSLMRASAILIAKMIKDNVFSVFTNALKLLQFLLNDYNKRHAVGKAEVIYVIERCLPPLLQRTGDTNARLRQRAHEFTVEMAVYPDVKPLHTVPAHCTLPMKPHCAPRLALSRVEIISDLIMKLGTKDNGLNVENVCKFCAYALEHNSGDVRELASKIIIQMYKEYGNIVRKYLPQDNEMNRRNKKYRIIYEAFDRIDGKPPPMEDKSTHDYLEKAKRLESEAIKREIKAVRDMRSRNTMNTDTATPRPGQQSQQSQLPSQQQQNKKAIQNSKSMNRALAANDRKTPLSMADESEFNPDNTCIFCAEKNEKFVKEGLELHYWKVCPMLKRCEKCKQVIEIAAQTEHLLTECEFKSTYKKCPRCSEAVPTQENDYHFKQKQCTPSNGDGANRCPLCHSNIPAGEEGWKEHLMIQGCPKNPRKPTTAAAANNNPDAKKAKK